MAQVGWKAVPEESQRFDEFAALKRIKPWLRRVRAQSTRPPAALCFHGVQDRPPGSDPFNICLSQRRLEDHIAFFVKLRYRFVTFSEFAAAVGVNEGEGLVSITFDDGFAEIVDVAERFLSPRNIPATAFLPSGLLGKGHPHDPGSRIVTVKDVGRLVRSGIEVGSHGVTHRDLRPMEPSEARWELQQSKRDLEDIIDGPVDVLAYPFGRTSPTTIALAEEAGYVAACGPGGTLSQRFLLPRHHVGGDTKVVRAWVASHHQMMSPLRQGRGLLAFGISGVRTVLRPSKEP